MESEPMLTPREKYPLPEKFSSEEDWTHDAASSRTVSPTHYLQAILAPKVWVKLEQSYPQLSHHFHNTVMLRWVLVQCESSLNSLTHNCLIIFTTQACLRWVLVQCESSLNSLTHNRLIVFSAQLCWGEYWWILRKKSDVADSQSEQLGLLFALLPFIVCFCCPALLAHLSAFFPIIVFSTISRSRNVMNVTNCMMVKRFHTQKCH